MPSLLEAHQLPEILKTLPEDALIVSPNQLSVYNRCAWSWEFRYVQNYHPIPTGDFAETGSLLHHLLEIYYKSKKQERGKANSYHLQKVHDEIAGLAKKLTTYDQMQQLTKAGRIAIRYCENVAPIDDKGLIITGVEKHFVVEMRTPKGFQYFLQGYVDLITTTGRITRIEDHKSTNGNNRFYSATQTQFDAQLKTYAIALNKLGHNVLDAAIRNYNTYDYKNFYSEPNEKLFSRVTAHYSPKELQTFEREIGLLVDEMVDKTIPKRRTLSKDCASCFVREACLLDMKGMDLKLLLATKYTRRKHETVKELVIGVDKPVRVE